MKVLFKSTKAVDETLVILYKHKQKSKKQPDGLDKHKMTWMKVSISALAVKLRAISYNKNMTMWNTFDLSPLASDTMAHI